jgi:hypothetical protein
MSQQSTSSHGVMEGKGAYNRHAVIPADGGALAMPDLAKAIYASAIRTETSWRWGFRRRPQRIDVLRR